MLSQSSQGSVFGNFAVLRMKVTICDYDIITVNYPLAQICLNGEEVGVSIRVFNMMIKIY